MSHADTLRGMAADQLRTGLTLLSAPHKTRGDALLAGAAALDTLDRVRNALTELDRLEVDTWAVWKQDADMHEQGRSDAYDHAHTIITRALGDTP